LHGAESTEVGVIFALGGVGGVVGVPVVPRIRRR
jgi:hypothetical protein